MSAEAVWILAERLSGQHIAQLYSHETVLLESLRMFTMHGVSRGEAVLLIFTPSRRHLIVDHLKADGVDVGGLQHDGQLLLLDAAEVLTGFMMDGRPDSTLFKRSVGAIVERMKFRGNRTVRVFGETADLLCGSNQPAAISLEHMWSELIESSDLSVVCAYSTSHVDESLPDGLRAPHSHIITSATVDSSGDAIVGHTLDRRIVDWNRGAKGIYGYAADEVIGQPSTILMPPGQDELPGVFERIRRGEPVENYETRRLRKDGTVIDVSVSVSPIKTRDGTIVGVSVVGRDISERKRTAEVLPRLAAVGDSSEDAIIVQTLDATIVYWNRGAERMYGYSAAEVTGRPISVLLPAGSEDTVPAVMARIRRDEQVDHYETKHQRKDGTIIDVSLTLSPIKAPGGESIAVSAVGRDITERDQTQVARSEVSPFPQSQAAHRLLRERVFETLEQERRWIARELHDEVGQLMASLLVGLRGVDDSTTVDEARAQAQRLRGIAARAMVEVGRLSRGLHCSVLDDDGLGVALQRYVADYSKTHKIAVHLTLKEPDMIGLSPTVQLAVFRIVQEALTNVARHSSATAITIGLARSSTRLETTISDNGFGFEAQANSVDSETHLGLQSMRERAVILGGTLRVSSGSTGTTILVTLPLDGRDLEAL